jgi:hypothetical protein
MPWAAFTDLIGGGSATSSSPDARYVPDRLQT